MKQTKPFTKSFRKTKPFRKTSNQDSSPKKSFKKNSKDFFKVIADVTKDNEYYNETYWKENGQKPATSFQLELLKKLNITYQENITCIEASILYMKSKF